MPLNDPIEVPPEAAVPADEAPRAPLLMKAPYDPNEQEEPHACCSDPRHQHR